MQRFVLGCALGDPVRLECSICGDEYFLHPADEKPVKNADLCPTCETFQLGMRFFYDDVQDKKDKVTLGLMIVGLSAFCVGLLILWLMFGR